MSSWIERTAYASASAIISVSSAMRDDILGVYPFIDPAMVHVVYNGIDVDAWQPLIPGEPDTADGIVRGYGIDPERPTVVFVGRITHQKGILTFSGRQKDFHGEVQVVLCAGAPDIPGTRVRGEGRRRGASGESFGDRVDREDAASA